MKELFYYHQPNCNLTFLEYRPIIVTPQGGKVAIDKKLALVWSFANNRTAKEIINHFSGDPPDYTLAALACLSEAGFLIRTSHKCDVVAVYSANKSVASNFSKTSYVEKTNVNALRYSAEHQLCGKHDDSVISIVIVSYNSLRWLSDCLDSILKQTYQRFQIIIVDNNSRDESVMFVCSQYPQVKVIALDSTVSLASAINKGIQEAEGDYFLLLNPDIYMTPNAIEEMLSIAESHFDVAGVGAKLLFLDKPAFINGIGNHVRSLSWGVDNGIGHLDLGQFDCWTETPSLCFACALISRHAWDQVGQLDEGYPLYYEDIDWSYRARLCGYKLYLAPRAVCYHAFGGSQRDSVGKKLYEQKLYNVVYGRHRFVQKILDKKRSKFTIYYLLEDLINITGLLLQGRIKSAIEYAKVLSHIIYDRSSIKTLRKQIQEKRRIDDNELFSMKMSIPIPLLWHGLPEISWDIVIGHYLKLIKSGHTRSLPELPHKKPSLAIVSHDVIDEKMAGPGMRYWEMARVLKSSLEIILAIPNKTSLVENGIKIMVYDESDSNSLQKIVEHSDVVLISGYTAEKFPFLFTTNKRIIVDLYTPMVLENLYYYNEFDINNRLASNYRDVEVMNKIVRLGDFFICGNQRQRDFWIGVLAANQRVNPLTYHEDNLLLNLIDVVSIGMPSRPPIHYRSILRGVHPAFPSDSKIILWGGGLWNWLDPLTIVEAWPKIIKEYPTARLVFLGTKHPNPLVPSHNIASKTIEKAELIGEKDKTIFFFEWLPYQDRESLLLEANIGISLHKIHLETHFSLRTRVLDYIWARLPVIITEGDTTSILVKEYGIGRVVPEKSPIEVATAVLELLQVPKEEFHDLFTPLLKEYSWENVVRPIVSFCLRDKYAPDRGVREVIDTHECKTNQNYWGEMLYKGWQVLRTQGIRLFIYRLLRYIRWRLSKP